MQNQTGRTDRLFNLFCLLGLTGFFALLEISFFITCNKAYLADFNTIAESVQIPWSIFPSLLAFISIHIAMHLVYCLFVFWVTCWLAKLFKLAANNEFKLGIGLWCLGILTVLLANQILYPQSKFTEIMAMIFPYSIAYPFFMISLGCCLILIVVAILTFFYQLQKKLSWPASILIVVASLWLVDKQLPDLIDYHPPVPKDSATQARPNIILIGVDALRTDFLSSFNNNQETPFLDAWLNQATVFGEAITPLARTFPSWMSVLTGQYPKETDARFDLADMKGRKLNTLSSFLQQKGYQTIFATDESRFSNIDESYGFDQIIAPPMGLPDFLLGTFNDFPLSNLIINTTLGKKLFPYSYANRGVYFSYDPDSFIQVMDEALKAKRSQPLFLAVHFCLPHYPYLWVQTPRTLSSAVERYAAAVNRVDKQLSDFFMVLNGKGLLQHAIVILLSDHGEALELNGDRLTEKSSFLGPKNAIPQFYPPSLDDEAINQSAGHGTDVLGLTQYQTLLAFRLYGGGQQQEGIISGVVSLIDIKPTLLSFLNFPTTTESGKSLQAQITQDRPKSIGPRHLFLETDFTPQAIRTIYPNVSKVLVEGAQAFNIDPKTMRLTLKPTVAEMVIKSKQYADIYGEWMLALYPAIDGTHLPVLINLKTGKWTLCLHSEYAKTAPFNEMLEAMKVFFSGEIAEISAKFC